MAIAILVDDQLVKHTGPVEITVNRKFQLNITAESAQRLVHNWLIDHVSSNIGSEPPTLVLETRPVWRVPAALSLPRYGRVGTVGYLEVDVESGEIRNLVESKAAIEATAEQLVQQLPPRSIQYRDSLNKLYSAHATASKLQLTEEDLQPTSADASTETPFLESVG
ncbi:MAG: hypothetical protein KDE53_31440 [Caldilineaceae bacterium]|nr:hypothetical protein [Caldilineaceae bacterium]MCB0125511.1 hypothetical protein [Caldilineaceae bacterium]